MVVVDVLLLRSLAMEVLRTPESNFTSLPGYPFEPKYHLIGGAADANGEGEHNALRMHYVDEGPKTARVILMLHGEPSWSYLYRHMIKLCAEANYRAVAPDLIGFGRSDKLPSTGDYSYSKHESWLESFVLGLDLKRIVLVCQDWGGLLGLRLVAKHPERFDAVVAANTFLPSGREPVSQAFLDWRRFSQEVPEFNVSKVIQGGCKTSLSEQVKAAYDAPFPDESYKAAARVFPALVPVEGDDVEAKINQELWKKLSQFDKPFLTAFSDGDPITRGADKILQAAITGAKEQPHTVIKGGGHFLQEDRAPELTAAVLKLANTIKT